MWYLQLQGHACVLWLATLDERFSSCRGVHACIGMPPLEACNGVAQAPHRWQSCELRLHLTGGHSPCTLEPVRRLRCAGTGRGRILVSWATPQLAWWHERDGSPQEPHHHHRHRGLVSGSRCFLALAAATRPSLKWSVQWHNHANWGAAVNFVEVH